MPSATRNIKIFSKKTENRLEEVFFFNHIFIRFMCKIYELTQINI